MSEPSIKTAGETESWLQGAKKEHRALFSELDVLLKAMDRFFIVDNQPASKSHFSTKNLYVELDVMEDAIQRVLSIIENVMPELNRNAYWFQKFAESKLLDNRKRDLMRAGMYKQDTPEKSFYVLYDSFINFKSLVADILKTQDINFMSFKNVGEIVSKEIRENAYFNPFRLDINPEYDYIDNKEITEIVRGIQDKETKKTASILFLHLFRLLRYMRTMDHRSLNEVPIHCSLLIFTLLKSEIDVFKAYVETSTKHDTDPQLSMLIRSLAYQISMEAKRVFQQELKDIYDRKNMVQLRGRIEASRGILKNLVEQSIIQLARHWNAEIRGEDIFEVFITKTAQSMKLREDLYVLNRLLGESVKQQGRAGVLSMLLNYMDYFENFTFKLLRFSDYENFASFFTKVRDLYNAGDDLKKMLDKCHEFNIFLDTTLRQIDNRADLKGRALDTDKAEEIVKQYLSAS